MPRDEWAARTIIEIGAQAFRESPGPEPKLTTTAGAISLLTPEALTRLSRFLDDLTQRHPMASAVWAGHRDVLECLANDLRRYADDETIEDIRRRAVW